MLARHVGKTTLLAALRACDRASSTNYGLPLAPITIGARPAPSRRCGGGSISESLAQADGATGAAAALGGGIYARGSTVELRGATLASNDVEAASAGPATSAGGGICTEGTSIVRVLEGSSIASSTVVATGTQTTRGGGIAIVGGELTVDASEVAENTVTASSVAGGGIYCTGVLVVRGSPSAPTSSWRARARRARSCMAEGSTRAARCSSRRTARSGANPLGSTGAQGT